MSLVDKLYKIGISARFSTAATALRKMESQGIESLDIEELSDLLKLVTYLKRSTNQQARDLGVELEKQLSQKLSKDIVLKIKRNTSMGDIEKVVA
jgi:hypothetical protein